MDLDFLTPMVVSSSIYHYTLGDVYRGELPNVGSPSSLVMSCSFPLAFQLYLMATFSQLLDWGHLCLT